MVRCRHANMTKQAKLWLLGFGALALCSGCSSSTAIATLELPHSLKIASISVVGSGQSWTAENPIALLQCPQSPPVLVAISPPPVFQAATSTYTIDNFTLAAPGDCGTNISCGWLKLRVTTNDGATVELSSATSPMTVNGVSSAGSVTFSLELHDAYDAPFKGSDGNAFGDEVTVDFTESGSCTQISPAGDAGV